MGSAERHPAGVGDEDHGSNERAVVPVIPTKGKNSYMLEQKLTFLDNADQPVRRR